MNNADPISPKQRDYEQILTPAGRLVQGSPWEPNTTDFDGNPLLHKSGPNEGKPGRVDYYMKIAIAKTDPGWPALWDRINAVAKRDWPAMFDTNGNPLTDFSFKLIDGDSPIPNRKGNKPCDHEGYPGHWVLDFSSGKPPKCYNTGCTGILTDPESIKRGFFIRIVGSVRGNDSQGNPGVYLNHNAIELVGFAEEINSGPPADAIFNAAPVATLPTGCSATPLAPSSPPPTPMGGQPGAMATTPPPGGVQPAHDFLQTTPGGTLPAPAATPAAGLPPSPAAAPAPPPPMAVETRYVASDGNVYTSGQLLANGYTLAQIQTLQVAP